jgi:hypothetical protein
MAISVTRRLVAFVAMAAFPRGGEDVKRTLQWLLACLVAFFLWFGVHVTPVCADVLGTSVRSGPSRPVELDRNPQPTVPLYSVGAGIVAMTLTSSFVAMRVIRKRNEK